MHLYFFRHGIAEDGDFNTPDSGRRLTEKGIQKLKRQAPVLKRMAIPLNHLFTSPYLRARETADILAPALGIEVEEASRLKPGCTLSDIEEVLAAHEYPEHVMFVGHQPDHGELVQALTSARIAMRKGALAVVKIDSLREGRGYLVGLYDPDVMAAIGR